MFVSNKTETGSFNWCPMMGKDMTDKKKLKQEIPFKKVRKTFCLRLYLSSGLGFPEKLWKSFKIPRTWELYMVLGNKFKMTAVSRVDELSDLEIPVPTFTIL